MTTKRGLGREQIHDAAWTETYPHPLLSCMMPIVAVLGVIAVVIFGMQIWQITLPRDATIPPIEGLKVDQAVTDLHRAGLNVEVLKDRRSSETIPNDAVLTAEPPGGRRVKMGRLVQLTLSSGSAFTIVPDVRELTQSVANERLLQAGLMISKEEYQFDKSIPFDRVVSITPKPGAHVKRMSTVEVVLSKGDEQSAANNPDASPEMRSTLISVTLPNTGDQSQQARIDVTDDDGTRTVYQQEHQPGDKVIYTVQGTGEMTIEVYFGDQKIMTKKY